MALIGWVSLFCKVIVGAGLGAYVPNLIQFGLDELTDASSTEITLFIFLVHNVHIHLRSLCIL